MQYSNFPICWRKCAELSADDGMGSCNDAQSTTYLTGLRTTQITIDWSMGDLKVARLVKNQFSLSLITRLITDFRIWFATRHKHALHNPLGDTVLLYEVITL